MLRPATSLAWLYLRHLKWLVLVECVGQQRKTKNINDILIGFIWWKEILPFHNVLFSFSLFPFISPFKREFCCIPCPWCCSCWKVFHYILWCCIFQNLEIATATTNVEWNEMEVVRELWYTRWGARNSKCFDLSKPNHTIHLSYYTETMKMSLNPLSCVYSTHISTNFCHLIWTLIYIYIHHHHCSTGYYSSVHLIVTHSILRIFKLTYIWLMATLSDPVYTQFRRSKALSIHFHQPTTNGLDLNFFFSTIWYRTIGCIYRN